MVTLAYMPTEHVPVLAAEMIRFGAPEPGDTVVDCTFGGGGHSRLIADRLGPTGTLICVDRDPIARDRFEQLAHEATCETRFMRTDFVTALEELAAEGVRPDLILFDLGVSSMQIDAWERGFSYAFDAPLDMRMDPDAELSATTILNEWPETRIAETLRNYGEEKHARSIAREIVARRPLETTSELVEAIRAGVPPKVRFGRGNPAKRSFQAIRIAVNGELDEIDAALPTAWDMLAARWPAGGHLLPFARGQARQALPRRPRPRMRLSARVPGLPLRTGARGRADHPWRRRTERRRGGRQPPVLIRPSARGPQA